jgi:hypothetical protein
MLLITVREPVSRHKLEPFVPPVVVLVDIGNNVVIENSGFAVVLKATKTTEDK